MKGYWHYYVVWIAIVLYFLVGERLQIHGIKRGILNAKKLFVFVLIY